jgi:hypothetical protein
VRAKAGSACTIRGGEAHARSDAQSRWAHRSRLIFAVLAECRGAEGRSAISRAKAISNSTAVRPTYPRCSASPIRVANGPPASEEDQQQRDVVVRNASPSPIAGDGKPPQPRSLTMLAGMDARRSPSGTTGGNAQPLGTVAPDPAAKAKTWPAAGGSVLWRPNSRARFRGKLTAGGRLLRPDGATAEDRV